MKAFARRAPYGDRLKLPTSSLRASVPYDRRHAYRLACHTRRLRRPQQTRFNHGLARKPARRGPLNVASEQRWPDACVAAPLRVCDSLPLAQPRTAHTPFRANTTSLISFGLPAAHTRWRHTAKLGKHAATNAQRRAWALAVHSGQRERHRRSPRSSG